MAQSGIKVLPQNIWQYFTANAVRLETTLLCVAENNDDGEWSVWITNDDGCPTFQVFFESSSIREYTAYSEDDIQDAYALALEDIGYIALDDDGGLPTASYSNEVDDEQSDYDIMIRESELDEVCEHLIMDVLEDEYDKTDNDTISEAVKTVKEVVCDILGKQYGFNIYRPMYLVSEDGSQFFSERPYPSILAAEKAERDRNRIKE